MKKVLILSSLFIFASQPVWASSYFHFKSCSGSYSHKRHNHHYKLSHYSPKYKHSHRFSFKNEHYYDKPYHKEDYSGKDYYKPHGHKHDYDVLGTVFHLPFNPEKIYHKGTHYFYKDGKFYRKCKHHGYHVVHAPIGVYIRNLPFGYKSYIHQGKKHYYNKGTHFVRHNGKYLVISEPEYYYAYHRY